MKATKLQATLGVGDESSWKALTQHGHSFLYVEVHEQEDVVAISELAWDPTKRKPCALRTGALGWVTLQQTSSPTLGVSPGQSFRVHVCRAHPCTAVYHPSKYGGTPPPLMHGKMIRCCDKDEVVCLEKEWASLARELLGLSAPAEAPAHIAEHLEGQAAATTAVAATTSSRSTSRSSSRSSTSGSTTTESSSDDDAEECKDGHSDASGQKEESPAVVGTGVNAPRVTDASCGARCTDVLAAPAPGPTSDTCAKMQTAIMSRADEVSLATKWIGAFEIMAFCALKKQRVILQLESGTVDVVGELAPALMDATWKVAPFQGRMVACRRVGEVWHPASWATCRHFVAAKPLGEPLPLHGDGVVSHMGRLGFATIMTQAKGDCGVESLLVLCDHRRGPREILVLRRQLQ